MGSMCRFVAYTGKAVPLGRLIEAPEHSLVVQSYRPREMRSGVVNADGFGVGWYVAGDDVPALFTSPMPIWADPNLSHLGRAVHAQCVLAAVRSATPGMQYGPEHVQPFQYGPYLFLHNGYITHFRQRLMRRLRAGLRDDLYIAIRGGSDSEHLFALWLEQLAQIGSGPAAMIEALQRTLAQVHRWAGEFELDALLTLALTDGRTLIAVRDGTTEYTPSLYVSEADPFFAGGVVIASEPLFSNGHWRPLPPHGIAMVDVDRHVQLLPLER